MRLWPLKRPGGGDRTLLFAMDTAFNGLYVFESKERASAEIDGLEIAEGNWLFFDAEGALLEAQFSVQPCINSERRTYTRGVYSLEAGAGQRLDEVLPNVSAVTGMGFETADDVQRFLVERRVARRHR